ncbi:MAG: polysaccharide lyase family protein [Candidatus Sumerlaeota bacterium]|nr:polysaccharide lyase family protein [Candidatus Sumerlaeota bacterium]
MLTRRGFLGKAGAGIAGAALASSTARNGASDTAANPSDLPEAGRVDLAETAETVALSNRDLRLVFQKRGGRLTRLAWRGRELISDGCYGYIQLASEVATKGSPEFAYRLCRHEPGLAEIAFVSTAPQFPFDLESHYVLRADEPGFHNYMAVSYDPAKHPGVQTLGQFNFTLRVDPALFTWAAVDDERIRLLPTPDMLKSGEKVMDATYRLPDGRVYSKYFYSATMDETHRVHGVMGEGIGLWIVMPSHEHLNGGPEHQELTVQQSETTPVLLRHFVAAHYGAGQIVTDPRQGAWSKTSATWFIYVNAGEDRAALWEDAKRRAEREAAAWPYPWLDDARFQLNRGAATGRLAFDDGSPAQGARVILAEHEENPTSLCWQQQWQGYRFYSRTDAQGRFAIEKARPGLYDFYAWTNGVPGQFVKRSVRVEAGRPVDLGGLVWSLPHDRQRLWQIGAPDRSAAEFGFAENYRQWGLWDKIAAAAPDGVTFTVGRNGDRKFPFEMAITQNPDLSWRLPVWRIEFEDPGGRTGKALLTLLFAGSHCNLTRSRGPLLNVSLNEEPLAEIRDLANDSAAHRSGVRGLSQEREIEFAAARLKPGVNTLTLEMPAPKPPLDRRIGYPGAAILWDCLRLEAVR